MMNEEYIKLTQEWHRKGFESRQAEIDELKATIVKYEAGLRKNKANKHKLLGEKIELQKRIDEALKVFKSDLSPIGKSETIHNILKGATP